MKQYIVFRHPAGSIDAVKQGWSWPAFFFTFLWALSKKKYWLGSGVFLGSIVVGLLLDATGADQRGNELVFFIAIINGVIFGINGNQLHKKNLVSSGFEPGETIPASSPASAIALHIKTGSSTEAQQNSEPGVVADRSRLQEG